MDDLLSLVIVGALAGTAVASLLGNRKKGASNLIMNTIIGIVGAIVGGFVFDLIDINPETGILATSISLGGLLAAIVGALIVIVIARAVNR